MGQELRRFPRAPIEVEVNLESANNFYAGITDNVSTGGVFVATHTPPPSGAEVELDLQLEDQKFRVRGVVCWVRETRHETDFAPAGCGVRFLSLSPDAERAIVRFIDKRDTILFDDE